MMPTTSTWLDSAGLADPKGRRMKKPAATSTARNDGRLWV
jgi:hypothetical protein